MQDSRYDFNVTGAVAALTRNFNTYNLLSVVVSRRYEITLLGWEEWEGNWYYCGRNIMRDR